MKINKIENTSAYIFYNYFNIFQKGIIFLLII